MLTTVPVFWYQCKTKIQEERYASMVALVLIRIPAMSGTGVGITATKISSALIIQKKI
jgi:hypothetical protein